MNASWTTGKNCLDLGATKHQKGKLVLRTPGVAMATRVLLMAQKAQMAAWESEDRRPPCGKRSQETDTNSRFVVAEIKHVPSVILPLFDAFYQKNKYYSSLST